MVDRVATALWPEYFRERVTQLVHCELRVVPADEVAVLRDWARGEARKALRAAREPTEEMVQAAEAEFFEHMPEARDWSLTMAKEAYQAAIDEALK